MIEFISGLVAGSMIITVGFILLHKIINKMVMSDSFTVSMDRNRIKVKDSKCDLCGDYYVQCAFFGGSRWNSCYCKKCIQISLSNLKK